MEINNTGIENVGRPIVNANINVTNVIEAGDIYSVMLDTFLDIVRILSDHCGPYGKFAMITSATNRLAEPVFTKDGIGIVRALEYMSVMQEYVRTTLAYMGSRIETAAGDGTTSSMIICAQGMYHLLKGLLESKHAYSYTELEREYKKFSKKIEEILLKNCYNIDRITASDELNPMTEEEKKTCIYRAAYAQAYTSSHGNTELSHAVATLFAETPKEAWNYLYIERAKFESDKQYEVAIDESQYTSNNVRIFPGSSLTDNMGTSRTREGVEIVLSGIAPTIDDMYVDGNELYKRIIASIADVENRECAFICPKDIDNNTLNHISAAFNKYQDTSTVLFLVDTSDPRLNDIVCMKVLNNDLSAVSTFVGNYTYEGSDLKITEGLYENKEDSKLNPMVNNPDYPALNEMMKNIDKIIEQIKSQTANRILNEQINKLQKLRLNLLVCKRTYFRIGGAAYDVAAATDVVLDAILAVKHSLTKGFNLGGNKALFMACMEYLDNYQYIKADQDPIGELHDLFSWVIRAGIEAVFEATVKWFDEDIRPRFDPLVSQNIANHESIPMKDRVTSITESICDPKNEEFIVPIIQPVSADIEIVRRFGELALKFVKTERIITPGGLVTNKKIDTV